MRLPSIAFAALAIVSNSHGAGPLEIRFNTPATQWDREALPIGNGRMGAMIYGEPLAERMQFNEISLWTGGENLSGGYDINQFGAFQNLGDLYLEVPGAEATAVSWPSAATHAAASSDQGIEKSVDGNTATKWCFEHLNQTVIWKVEYPFARTFGGYSLTSAEDVPARDPKSWTFEGSTDGANWTPLDSRTLGAASTPVWPFPNRKQKVDFIPAATGSFRFYRFVFAPNTAVPHFQVSEIALNPVTVQSVTNPSLADHAAPSAGQMVDKSVDGSGTTKWCFVHQNKNIIWQAQYPQPVAFNGYSLTSAEDVPERDPKSWTFEGSADGSTWTQLDSRSLTASTTPVWPFAARNQRVDFTAASSGAYRYYRFVFVPNTAVPHFQVAEIKLNDAPPNAVPANLVRALDVGSSTHRVTWSRDGVNFTRESVASHPHNVIATRITADQPGKITTRVRLVGAHGELPTASGNETGFSAALTNNGLRYATGVRVLNTGGTVITVGNTLLAENCDSLVILHAAATDYAMDATTTPPFRSGTAPATVVASRLTTAAAAGYDTIHTAHLADFHQLFNRVKLDLGTVPANNLITTRLSAYKTGAVDRHLEELLFQYGRYLMISSSRDSLPANLQGLWNNSNTPAWSSDYHVNINVQMNYWMNGSTNLAECQEPLFNFLGAIRPLSIAATKASFGATTPGWTMRTSVNPFGGHGWQWDTPSSAWLARHYWDQYAFTGDTAFLQNTAWPIMKEICQYWIAQLIDNGSGKLVAPNGWSPEHGPFENGVSYQQEIVWDLLTNTISAADALGIEPTFRAQLADVKSRLLVPAIGPQGQITEWANSVTEAANGYGTSGHRHTSHLYAIYPGFQFNPVETPAYVTAGKLSLQDRGTSGDSRQSWTWPWRTALWARMGEANKAYDMVRGLLTYNSFPNLFAYANSGVYQIDGNLGYPAAVAEMLLQSQSGEIAILPALPTAWADGSFTGLCARGGFEIDAAWQNGVPSSIQLRSLKGKNAVIHLPASVTSPGAFVRGGGATRAATVINGRLVFPTSAGVSYSLDTNLSTTADTDGDGATTYQEWLAGTDPDKADARLAVTLVKDGSGWKATWPVLKGRKYVLQFSPDLQTWNNFAARLPEADGTASVDVTAGTKEFYRVVVSLP